MRCSIVTLNRVAIASIAIMAIGSTGCKSGMSGRNMFAFGRKPSAETLAGSGPTTTYASVPSKNHTPTTIASAATGTTTSPQESQIAGATSSPYGNPSMPTNPYAPATAAGANGYNAPSSSPYGNVASTSPYGQPSPQAISPYQPKLPGTSPYGMPSSGTSPSPYATASTTPYTQPTSSPYGAVTPGNQPAYSVASSAPSYSAPSYSAPSYSAPTQSPTGYAPPSGVANYALPTGTSSPYANPIVAPPTTQGGYRPGSTASAAGYPGMSSGVAPSAYTTPATQTPGSTYSLPTATTPGGSIYR